MAVRSNSTEETLDFDEDFGKERLFPERPQYKGPISLPQEQKNQVDVLGDAVNVGVLIPDSMDEYGLSKEIIDKYMEWLAEQAEKIALGLEANELAIWIAQQPEADQWVSLNQNQKLKIVEDGIWQGAVPGLWTVFPGPMMDAWEPWLLAAAKGPEEALEAVPALAGELVLANLKAFIYAFPTIFKLFIFRFMPAKNMFDRITKNKFMSKLVGQFFTRYFMMGWRVINFTTCVYWFFHKSGFNVYEQIIDQINKNSEAFTSLAKYLKERPLLLEDGENGTPVTTPPINVLKTEEIGESTWFYPTSEGPIEAVVVPGEEGSGVDYHFVHPATVMTSQESYGSLTDLDYTTVNSLGRAYVYKNNTPSGQVIIAVHEGPQGEDPVPAGMAPIAPTDIAPGQGGGLPDNAVAVGLGIVALSAMFLRAR